jgi:F0F1-type ATP synthase membrane subunit b/b'
VDHHLNFFSAIGIPYFNFFVFVAAFVFLFRKPLLEMVAARRQNYLSASKEAAQALDAARKAFDEVKQRFDALDRDLADFRKQSESAAHEEARRMIDETERFTRQIKEETARMAKEAVERARVELREEIVEAAKGLAATRISKELDAAAKEKILKSKIASAAAMSAQ